MEYLIFVGIVCISIWGYRRIKWLENRNQDFWNSNVKCGFVIWLLCGFMDIIICLALAAIIVYLGGQLIKWIAL